MLKLSHPESGNFFYATQFSAGFDIYSIEDVVIRPGYWETISTGLYIEEILLHYPFLKFTNKEKSDYGREEELLMIPEIQIRSRSGLAINNGIVILGGVNTIDIDYKADIKVPLFNHGKNNFRVEKGDRIAQGICSLVHQLACLENRKTKRGNKGLGSSGVK